jgi:2-polyprenyl-6-methoxyphenol hydroxylase-like FAD-dependent oxidoreductase
MTQSRVLISGAGIGGPALALALLRRGFEVTVVERAESLRSGGYKVDVRGAGTTALRRLGLYDQARACDVGMRQVTYVRRDGRRIAALPADLLMGRRGDDIEVMRGDLTQILYGAGAAGVEYVFGDSVTGLTQDPGGVDVTFERAAPRRFDYVVGADGLYSATRRLVGGRSDLGRRAGWSDSSGAIEPTHLGAYISIFSVPNHLRIDREEFMFSRPGRLVFAYAMGPDQPAKAGLVMAAPRLDYDRRDIVAQKRLVREAFAGLGWETDRFLAGLDAAGDFYFDSIAQVELPSWSAGRVVLTGDAAHCPSPASGQGTSLALVGAHVLGRHLGEPGGFEAYEQAMRPYVAKNMAFGRKMVGDMVPGGRLAIALRNYGMRTLRFHPRKEQVIEKVLAPLREAAGAISI